MNTIPVALPSSDELQQRIHALCVAQAGVERRHAATATDWALRIVGSFTLGVMVVVVAQHLSVTWQ